MAKSEGVQQGFDLSSKFWSLSFSSAFLGSVGCTKCSAGKQGLRCLGDAQAQVQAATVTAIQTK